MRIETSLWGIQNWRFKSRIANIIECRMKLLSSHLEPRLTELRMLMREDFRLPFTLDKRNEDNLGSYICFSLLLWQPFFLFVVRQVCVLFVELLSRTDAINGTVCSQPRHREQLISQHGCSEQDHQETWSSFQSNVAQEGNNVALLFICHTMLAGSSIGQPHDVLCDCFSVAILSGKVNNGHWASWQATKRWTSQCKSNMTLVYRDSLKLEGLSGKPTLTRADF